MIAPEPLLVTLIKLIDRIPTPPPEKRRRGRPNFYADRRCLKALVMMIARHVHTIHELLSALEQPTPEMQALRALLTEQGRSPPRRTWERRLQVMLATLPAQMAGLGRYLVALIQPWATCGRGAAIDSTTLKANGGGWHKKDREAGVVPHPSIDTETHWTQSGWHGWVYGWQRHLVATMAAGWIPLAADLTPANVAANAEAPALMRELPPEPRCLTGDLHYNAPNVQESCDAKALTLVTTQYGLYPHRDDGKEVRRTFHKLRAPGQSSTATSTAQASLTATATSRPKTSSTPAALPWAPSSCTNSPCSTASSMARAYGSASRRS